LARAGQRSGASSFRLASSFKLRSVTSFQSTATHLGKALAACCAFMNSCVHRLRWYGSGVSPRTLTLSAQPTSKRHMLRRFLKKNVLIQDVGAGLIQMSYFGKFGSRVAYPLAADNVWKRKPTVCLDATSLVVCSYGCDDGRIGPTHCAVIGVVRGDRSRAH
jgi:hypothetical protein